MRILAVTPYYEPEGGGLERYAHEILKRLVARGHDVEAHAFTATRRPSDVRDGVVVHRRSPWLRLGNSPIDPTFYRAMKKAIHRFSPDVVLGHTPVPFAAEVAEAAAHRADVPFVTSYHAGRLSGSSFLLKPLAAIVHATFEQRMLMRSRHLIASSPYVRDHPLAPYRARVTVVPPGVDTRRFLPWEQPTSNEILFVGPLAKAYRWKGVDTLWQAFHLVRASVPDATLTLAGQGDRSDAFTKLAREDGSLRLTGRLSDQQLVAEYQRASVVVLPSTSDAEAFGMVLAEANACGRPVVGSRIGGIPDFVTHGENGLLAIPGDPVDLARHIVTLLRDKELARTMGNRGHEKVVRDHHWGTLSLQTEQILDAAAQGRVNLLRRSVDAQTSAERRTAST